MTENHIPKVFWLWVPMAIAIGQVILELTVDKRIVSISHSENGPHELMQFVFITLAGVVAAVTLIKYRSVMNLYTKAWIFIALLACIFVSGEEVSWGQHFFEWTTPQFWLEVNDQQETNLHNTSSWLDQKPRLILEIGVIIGGLLMPLLAKFKPSILKTGYEIIYPPVTLWITALLAELPKYIEKINNKMGEDFFVRESEIQELYFFYFVLLYLVNFYRARKVELNKTKLA